MSLKDAKTEAGHLLDDCWLTPSSDLSSWKTEKEGSNPFFFLPYVAIVMVE